MEEDTAGGGSKDSRYDKFLANKGPPSRRLSDQEMWAEIAFPMLKG